MKTRSKKTYMLYSVIGVMIVVIVAVNYVLKSRESEASKRALLESAAEEGWLTYGADDSAPPLRYVDKDGIYKGVVVDYMQQLSLELGVEIHTVPYKWEKAIEALKVGETDLCDMFVNDERSKYFVFSDAIYNLRTVMVIKREREYGLGHIDGLTIATQKGDYANDYLAERYPNAKLVYTYDIGEGLDLLVEGKVDGVIGDEPVMVHYASDRGYSEYIKTIETSLYEEPVVLALPKDKKLLLPLINEAIASIKNKGQLEKIQQKWFGISTPLLKVDYKKDYINLALLTLGVVLIIIIVGHLNSKNLKRQVRIRTKELDSQKKEMQLVLEHMPEGIALVSRSGEIVYGNNNFFYDKRISRQGQREGYFNGTPRENSRESDGCSELMHAICEGRCCGSSDECLVKRCLEKEEPIVERREVGNQIFEIHAVPTDVEKNGEGDEEALLVVRNITVAESDSRQLLQTSKMIAIGQLAGGMAHQIRNPLGIIRTHSYLIRKNVDGLGETGEVQELRNHIEKSLNYIDDGVERASGIIDNVMNFWRVSSNKMTQLNVRKYMENVLLLQDNEIKKKSVKCIVDCRPETNVRTNEESLKHILHNLVSNSVDAVGNGGEIRLTAFAENNVLTLICRDNGYGIKEKDLPNLFNPFFTTKEPGKGTGLGLFIVYSEVERLGGSVDVSSTEGVYTEFTIKIPEGQE